MDDDHDDLAPPEDCHYCGGLLSASDVALYGDARSEWDRVAAHSPDRVGPEPFPTCLECSDAILANRETLDRENRESGRWRRSTNLLIFGGLLLFLVITWVLDSLR